MQPDDDNQIQDGYQPISPQVIAPQVIAPQIIAPHQIVHPGIQQVVYIPLKYSPEVNLRTWSYLPLGLGIAIYLASVAVVGSGSTDVELMSFLGTSACCGLFAVAFFLDAIFYKGKSEWQASTGQLNGGSVTGMVFDIIFGVISIIIAIYIMFVLIVFS